MLFITDGVRADLVDEGCRAGWLPNIQRRFVAGGTRVENAITVFPAITYSVITSLLTGVSPAVHGIPGNRWFDPDLRLFRNYVKANHYRDINGDVGLPTIYQRIAPRASTNIQTAFCRGVTDDIANTMQSGALWFFGDFTGVDTLTADTVGLVADHANAAGVWPALLTCYFPGGDTVGHRCGPSSRQYHDALQNIDHQIGRICDWLEAEGLLDSTYLVLVADHGQVDVAPEGVINLMRLVRSWGRLPTDSMDQDDPFDKRRRFFQHFDSVVAYQNGRKALLHFRGASGWDERPSPALVEQILTQPPPEKQLWNIHGIDLVAYLANEHEAILRSPRGDARIEERLTPTGPEYRYVPEPGDPLDYLLDSGTAAFVAEGFHPSRAWLDATCAAEFPDLVPQLIPLMRSRRGGQVVVCATPGHSFKFELGGHGAIRRDEMRVPMMFAGPGIPAGGTLKCARAVDMVPTLLALLGLEPPDDGLLEGTPLFTNLPAAASSQP